jgi:hypothetical protein
LTEDNIKWDEPPADDYIEWESPVSTTPQNSEVNLFKRFTQRARKFDSRWMTVFLLAGIIFMSSIIVFQNNRITQLQNDFDQMHSAYDDLQEDYNQLLSNYSDLFSDLQQLETAFEDPLASPRTPTIQQVRNWLAQDTTDQCDYKGGVWSCGDFAAMLMTHAKEMNWRIRIAVIFYSLEGEPFYGSTASVYGSHGHAFNVVECTDGIWYIEPQSDGTWYIVTGGTHERTEFHIFTYYDFVDSTSNTLWDGLNWWTNFYSQFA